MFLFVKTNYFYLWYFLYTEVTYEFLASETFDELSELNTPQINQMEDDSPFKNKQQINNI